VTTTSPSEHLPIAPTSQADDSVGGVVDRSVVAGEAPSTGVVMREVLRVRGTSAWYCADGAASGSLMVRGRLLTERAGLSDLRPASQRM